MSASPVPSIRILVVLLFCLSLLSVAGAQPKVRSHQPLITLSESVQTLSPENLQLNLRIDKAVPLPDGGSRPLEATLRRTDGTWEPGTAKTPGYNTSTHTVDASGLKVTEETIRGTFEVTIRPDRWVPQDGKPRTLTVRLDGRLEPLDRDDQPEQKVPSRFWLIKPKSQSASMQLAGKAVGRMDGRSVEGTAGGTFQLPVRIGKWNMGTWDKGLQLHFDMGRKRVNWNHVRLAIYEFPRPLNLAHRSGLRVELTTAKPRQDVSVTVWLAEADGSWYYVRSAVPLVDEKNQAVLLFEDFVEAEWVAPGSHMDEDYVLDLSSLKKIAIGVVNPLGVGEVDFKVTELDLVQVEQAPQPPAQARVTGKTLAVNGHNVVPAGIFGGYAGDLPQKFRPGTQRYLYAPIYPRIPEQIRVTVSRSEIRDHRTVVSLLLKDDAIGKHLRARLGPKRLRDLTRRGQGWLKSDNVPKNLDDILNDLLRSPDLYAGKLMGQWVGQDLAAELKQAAGRSDTKRMTANRKLLVALFGGALAPAPEQGPTEAFYIECYGERKQPAQVLWGPDWKEDLARWGRTYATNARKNDYIAHFEFWNEPYLNWAERSRVNYNLKFYDVSRAKVGGPVHTKYGLEIPHLSWRKTEKGKWQVYDPTAFSYWSGRGNGWMYDQMFRAVATPMKEVYPEMQVIAGWGFRWNEDHWAAWDILYKPTIDRNIELIDGIHEHHYQGDTTTMNATYEVLTAYGVTAHDKWLYSYNTETNDLVDAPARGAVDTPDKARAAKEYRRMTYNLRDLLYCVHQSPDKARARTMIHWSHTPLATEITFGLTKVLRGRLVECRSSDPDVWTVASIDGTDPAAMPPEGARRLVVFVYNNHRRPRKVELTIRAPDGARFDTAQLDQTWVDKQDWKLGVRTKKLQPEADSLTVSLDLADRAAARIVLDLADDFQPVEADQVRRHQYFSADILQHLPGDRSFTTTIKLPGEKLRAARRAWLRLVVENVAIGEGRVDVGGKTYSVPKAYTGDNQAHIVEIPVEPGQLSETTELTFRVAEGNFDGYRVDMASLVLEVAD